MKAKLLTMRILLLLAGSMLASAPSAVFAHENVGGDELAAANWMLIGAFIVALTGVLAGMWAWRSGQFTNIEDSKYIMLDTADNFDTIMAEADARDSQSQTTENSVSKHQNVAGSVGRSGA